MMGFSPGEFKTESGTVHWEGKGNGDIILWTEHETEAILWLTTIEARKAANQLMLLVEMAEEDRL